MHKFNIIYFEKSRFTYYIGLSNDLTHCFASNTSGCLASFREEVKWLLSYDCRVSFFHPFGLVYP